MITLPPIGSIEAPSDPAEVIQRVSYIDMTGVLQPGETLSGTPRFEFVSGSELISITEIAIDSTVTDVGGISIEAGYAITFLVTVLSATQNDKAVMMLFYSTTGGDREPLKVVQPVQTYSNSS